LLPAAAVPGRDGSAFAGRHCLADPHILRGQDNATVLLAEVAGVDTAGRRVLLGGAEPLPYDYLVIATGSIHSYFGHDEWGERAGPQAHRRCDPYSPQHPAGLRAGPRQTMPPSSSGS